MAERTCMSRDSKKKPDCSSDSPNSQSLVGKEPVEAAAVRPEEIGAKSKYRNVSGEANPGQNGPDSEGKEEMDEGENIPDSQIKVAPIQQQEKVEEKECVREENKVKKNQIPSGKKESKKKEQSRKYQVRKKESKYALCVDIYENPKHPAYVPRKGSFFEHDMRGHARENMAKHGFRKPGKDEGRWNHDKFREMEPDKKSRKQLIARYVYGTLNRDNRDQIRARSPLRGSSRGSSRGRKEWDEGVKAWHSDGRGRPSIPPSSSPLPAQMYLPPQNGGERGRYSKNRGGGSSSSSCTDFPMGNQDAQKSDGLSSLWRQQDHHGGSRSYSSLQWGDEIQEMSPPAERGMESEYPPAQPADLSRQQAAVPNPSMHLPCGLPGFSSIEEMGVASSWAELDSSQRQGTVPDPAPIPVHHTVPYQGPVYMYGVGPALIPLQNILVQPEMQLPYPGLHPHQSRGPVTYNTIYGGSPVLMLAEEPHALGLPVYHSQGPPQQVHPPPVHPTPGVTTFPYPYIYPRPHDQFEVSYYEMVQQQVLPPPFHSTPGFTTFMYPSSQYQFQMRYDYTAQLQVLTPTFYRTPGVTIFPYPTLYPSPQDLGTWVIANPTWPGHPHPEQDFFFF